MKLLKALLLSLSLVGMFQMMAQSMDYPYGQQNNSYSSQINWLTSFDQAVAQSRATSKPILILFTGTTWCPACMRLERDVISRSEFAQALSQRFIFLKAEFPDYSEGGVQASPFKNLLDRYRVDAFPTMLVVNTNGQPLYSVPYQTGGLQAYIQQFMRRSSDQGQMQGQMMSYPR